MRHFEMRHLALGMNINSTFLNIQISNIQSNYSNIFEYYKFPSILFVLLTLETPSKAAVEIQQQGNIIRPIRIQSSDFRNFQSVYSNSKEYSFTKTMITSKQKPLQYLNIWPLLASFYTTRIFRLITGALLEISIHGCHYITFKKFCGCHRPYLSNKTQNFAGAKIYISKFCGCQAPVAPVLTRPLNCTLLFKSIQKNPLIF